MPTFEQYKATKAKELVLWSDRKRILGMPISFTVYSVLPSRIQVKRGFFSTKIDDTLLYRVLDIEVSRSFGQKIFGVGTVRVFAADRSSSVLELKNIANAVQVGDFLGDLVERARNEKRIVGREMFGTGAVATPGDIDGDGIPDFIPDDYQQ